MNRVFELAKALGVNSKGLTTLCKDMGEPVKSHMSLISEELWNKLQDRMNVPAEKRVAYVKKVAKKKSATKKSSVTSKTRKGKASKEAETPEGDDASQAASPSKEPTAKKTAKTQMPVKPKKPAAPSKKKPEVKAEEKAKMEQVREDKVVGKTGDMGLIKKKHTFAAPLKDVETEQVEQKSHVEEVRQRVQDRQDSEGDQKRSGGLIRSSSRSTKRQALQNRVAARRGRRRKVKGGKVSVEEIKVKLPITVRQLSSDIHLKVNDMINRIKHHDGTQLDPESNLTEDDLINIGLLFGIEITVEEALDREQEILKAEEQIEVENETELYTQERPPVVAVLGHVDHGKTSLLDHIRKASVAAREAGGITQHIGAYQVKRKDKLITFIDTPGHQLFTEMRARGAQTTDIVILVVAADDGVMPQTEESIQHAKAAGTPVIVAINKIDTEGADIEKVKSQLTQFELVSEEWGGSTIMCPVSAMTGEGIDHLIDMIQLQSEILELKANPDLPAARGVVLESTVSKQKGVVATLLVQNGSLKKGDMVVCGATFGKVRALVDENNQQHKVAPPSKPVQVFGLNEAPDVASKFLVVDEISKARELAELRADKLITKERDDQPVSLKGEFDLDDVFDVFDDEEKDAISIIVKSDVRGSLEALAAAIEGMTTSKVPVKIISKGVGGISESDIILAKASNAMVLGFGVVADAPARKAAKANKVEIKLYRVIYELLDDLRAAMEGRVASEIREEEIGQAKVRAVFKSSKFGMICGTIVTDGVVRRGCHVRVSRNGVVIHHGVVDSLRRFKEDAKEVKDGFECGIRVRDYDDIKPEDSIHFFERVEVAGKLD